MPPGLEEIAWTVRGRLSGQSGKRQVCPRSVAILSCCCPGEICTILIARKASASCSCVSLTRCTLAFPVPLVWKPEDKPEDPPAAVSQSGEQASNASSSARSDPLVAPFSSPSPDAGLGVPAVPADASSVAATSGTSINRPRCRWQWRFTPAPWPFLGEGWFVLGRDFQRRVSKKQRPLLLLLLAGGYLWFSCRSLTRCRLAPHPCSICTETRR